jgi:hypothetical protein
MSRPLAIMDVYNLTTIISYLLLSGKPLVSQIEKSGKYKRTQEGIDYLRAELEIADQIPSGFFRNHGVERSELTLEEPPAISRRIAEDCFGPNWGTVILNVLESFYPYKVHIEAVNELKEKLDHTPTLSIEQKLAKAMLFEGQGLWWICQNSSAKQAKEAVEIADDWIAKFYRRRAQKYLQQTTVSDEQIKMSKTIYDVYKSKAFQIGLFMTIAYLKDNLSLELGKLEQLAHETINTFNKSYENNESVREVLFNRENDASLRYCYKARKLSVSDWTFMRAVLLSLLS